MLLWGCSSNGRALASHARGRGIDTPHLQFFFFSSQLALPGTASMQLSTQAAVVCAWDTERGLLTCDGRCFFFFGFPESCWM